MHWVSGYAELHCHANFSFLDGASHPEDLVETAVELGYQALAVTDHNGFYGGPSDWKVYRSGVFHHPSSHGGGMRQEVWHEQ